MAASSEHKAAEQLRGFYWYGVGSVSDLYLSETNENESDDLERDQARVFRLVDEIRSRAGLPEF